MNTPNMIPVNSIDLASIRQQPIFRVCLKYTIHAEYFHWKKGRIYKPLLPL